MNRHLITMQRTCPRCKSEAATETYVAEARAAGVRFSARLSCPECKLEIEADGPELTDDARDAFIKAEGSWHLVLKHFGHNKAKVLRSLADRLGVPIAQMVRLAQEGSDVADGSLVEMEAIAMQLQELGAETQIARSEPT